MANNLIEVYEFLKDKIHGIISQHGFSYDTCRLIKSEFTIFGVDLKYVSPVYSLASSSLEGIDCRYEQDNKKYSLTLTENSHKFQELKWV